MSLSGCRAAFFSLFYYVGLTNGERGRPRAAPAWAWEENQIEVITGSRLTNAIKVKKEWWNGCVYYVSVWIRGDEGPGSSSGGWKNCFSLVWLMCEVSCFFHLFFPSRVVLLWCWNNDACYRLLLDRCRNIQQLPRGWEFNEKAQSKTFLKGLYRDDACLFLVWVTTISYLFRKGLVAFTGVPI